MGSEFLVRRAQVDVTINLIQYQVAYGEICRASYGDRRLTFKVIAVGALGLAACKFRQISAN